jgi:hypothetical protein
MSGRTSRRRERVFGGEDGHALDDGTAAESSEIVTID